MNSAMQLAIILVLCFAVWSADLVFDSFDGRLTTLEENIILMGMDNE